MIKCNSQPNDLQLICVEKCITFQQVLLSTLIKIKMSIIKVIVMSSPTVLLLSRINRQLRFTIFCNSSQF